MQCGRLPKVPLGIADRADAHLDARLQRAPRAPCRPRRRDRVRRVRIAVRVAPRPVLAGDRQLALDALVVGLAAPSRRSASRRRRRRACAPRSRRDGSAACSPRSGSSSRRRRGRSCSCPARPGPRRRSRAARSSRACAEPASSETQSRVGIPERPGLDDHDPPAAAGKALGERRSRPRPRPRSRGPPPRRRRSGACARGPGCRAGAGRAGTRSRCRRGAARPSPAGGDPRRSRQPPLRHVRRPGPGRRPPALSSGLAPAARPAAGACSRAGRPGRRSRSRSTPTGASRTPTATPRITTLHAFATGSSSQTPPSSSPSAKSPTIS